MFLIWRAMWLPLDVWQNKTRQANRKNNASSLLKISAYLVIFHRYWDINLTGRYLDLSMYTVAKGTNLQTL